MARAAAKRKKRDIGEELRNVINRILNDAVRSRKGFTPELIASYEEAAIRRREEREEQRRPIRELRPSRNLSYMVARRKAKKEETTLSQYTTRSAIMAALDLGERLELARKPRDLRLKEWVMG